MEDLVALLVEVLVLSLHWAQTLQDLLGDTDLEWDTLIAIDEDGLREGNRQEAQELIACFLFTGTTLLSGLALSLDALHACLTLSWR